MRRPFLPYEVLIAVLLLALLGLIALPNFRDAETHGRLASSKALLARYAVALASYEIDHGAFPPCSTFGTGNRLSISVNDGLILERLTTPVAYMADALIITPFVPLARVSDASAAGIAMGSLIPIPSVAEDGYRSIYYQSGEALERVQYTSPTVVSPPNSPAIKYLLQVAGPRQTIYNMGGVLFNAAGDGQPGSLFEDCLGLVYDPTNGTSSFGNFWHAVDDTDTAWGKQMFLAAQTSPDFAPQNVIDTW